MQNVTRKRRKYYTMSEEPKLYDASKVGMENIEAYDVNALDIKNLETDKPTYIQLLVKHSNFTELELVKNMYLISIDCHYRNVPLVKHNKKRMPLVAAFIETYYSNNENYDTLGHINYGIFGKADCRLCHYVNTDDAYQKYLNYFLFPSLIERIDVKYLNDGITLTLYYKKTKHTQGLVMEYFYYALP